MSTTKDKPDDDGKGESSNVHFMQGKSRVSPGSANRVFDEPPPPPPPPPPEQAAPQAPPPPPNQGNRHSGGAAPVFPPSSPQPRGGGDANQRPGGGGYQLPRFNTPANAPVPPVAVAATHQAPNIEFGKGDPCNYIMAIGRQGSGKSTLQSHLLRYLKEKGDFDVSEDPSWYQDTQQRENVGRYEILYKDWVQRWKVGLFPRATETMRPTEFRWVVKPRTGQKAIRFGFLEIAGEDFNTLTRVERGLPTLLPSIDKFLNNPKVTVAFLFVSQADNLESDDYLFTQFLRYVDTKVQKRFRKRTSAALVLADPDACARKLAFARQLPPPEVVTEIDIEGFVDEFIPLTAAELGAWGDRAMMTVFSVGTVQQLADVDGNMHNVITKPAFGDARNLFEWLYKRYTGIELGPGVWWRMYEYLKGLGGGK